MPLSVSNLVLRAKELEIEAVRHLAARVELAQVIGQLIHALQRERGATSIYLASGGQRFDAERQQAVSATQPLEDQLKSLLALQLNPEHGASARMLSLMAWVLLDMQALAGLRYLIGQRTPSAHDAVAAYSRLIAGLVELIFHVADAAAYPGISRLLVAFVHLVQGKEAAGQERALGAQLFASGVCDDATQQRLVHLIDAQERSLGVFDEFAEPALRARWQQGQLMPHVAQLERMRRTLCTSRPQSALDTTQSESWFDATSARIAEMWQIEGELVACLRQTCADQIRSAEQALQDSESLLRQLRDNPPPHTHAVDRFFSDDAASHSVPTLPTASTQVQEQAERGTIAALQALLQAQSARLASMETELDAAKRALNERKLIERAKGALMSRMGLSEEAAFRALQKASMDHNRRLVDVAEAMLALPDVAFGPTPGAQPPR
jgi:hypothetical protein